MKFSNKFILGIQKAFFSRFNMKVPAEIVKTEKAIWQLLIFSRATGVVAGAFSYRHTTDFKWLFQFSTT